VFDTKLLDGVREDGEHAIVAQVNLAETRRVRSEPRQTRMEDALCDIAVDEDLAGL
jgi:hypothetical protein